MKNILILNGHQFTPTFAEGNLTNAILTRAKNYFEQNGFVIKTTKIEDGYNIEEEIQKLSWADYILFQFPVFWMSMPWKAKKYFDEVLNAGNPNITYRNDGRSREDLTKTYGSGGMLTNTKYMLSMTYNCPESEFDNTNGFFDGLSLDQANISVHKIFQFCGLQQLKTFVIFDVFKGNLDLELELNRLEQTLKENFQ